MNDIEEQKAKRLTLRSNVSWIFVGDSVYSFSQWLIIVLMAKIGDPNMVGEYALGLAITDPVLTFTNMALRSVHVTDADDDYLFKEYLGFRVLSTVIALIIIGGILLSRADHNGIACVILLIGLAKVVDSVLDIFYGLYQKYERMDRIAISKIIRGFLSPTLIMLGIYISGKLIWGLIGLVVSRTLIFLFHDFLHSVRTFREFIISNSKDAMGIFNQFTAAWKPTAFKQILIQAFPLGLTGLLISLNNNIPRYFIESNWSTSELGIFTSLMSFAAGGRIVVNALGQAATPRLAKFYNEGKSKPFYLLGLKLITIVTFFGLATIFFTYFWGEEILSIIFTKEYVAYGDFLPWVMTAGLVMYIYAILGVGITAVRYFRIQPLMLGSAVVVTFFLSLILISEYGIRGAIYTIILSGLFQIALRFIINVHAMRNISPDF